MAISAKLAILSSTIIEALKIFIIYHAAFSYCLDWRGMFGVVFVVTMILSSIDGWIISKLTETEVNRLINEYGNLVLAITTMGMITILTILTKHLSFLAALGIYFVPGLLITLVRLFILNDKM